MKNNCKICVKNKETISLISVSDIVYFNSINNYTEVVCRDGSIWLSKDNLNRIEIRLTSCSFFRCHRSYLINMDALVEFNKNSKTLLLANNIVIPLARRREKEFYSKLATLSVLAL